MAEVLGIDFGKGTDSDVNSFDATALPNLAGIKNVFIESQALGEDNLIQSNSKIKKHYYYNPYYYRFWRI